MAAFTIASTLFGMSGKASSFFGVAKGRWREIALGVLLAIVVYQNMFDTRVFFWADTIPHLRGVIQEQEIALDTVVAANDKLADAIEKTNSEIEQARRITQQLVQQKNVLEDQLRDQQEETRTQVQAILNSPTPQTCQAAIGFLRDMIPNLQYDSIEE